MENIDINILKYGIFDSNVAFPNITETSKRKVLTYELELFAEDCSGICFIDNEVYKLKKGKLIFAKPNQIRHSILPFRACFIHFTTESEEFKNRLNSIKNTYYLPDYKALAEMFYEITAVSGDSFSDRLYIQSISYRILQTLIQISEKNYSEISFPHIDLLKKAKKYIDSNYDKDLDLNILSEIANLSPVYFHKLFKSYFGKTPAEAVSDVRISNAKRLLISSDKTVLQISEECGFSSQAYFNYKFRSAVGTSPLKFKKDILSSLEL